MTEPAFTPNVDTTKASLTDLFMRNAAITGYAIEVRQFSLVDLPRQSAWHTAFKLALSTAQRNGETWQNSLSPRLFAEVPQSLIDYGNLFAVGAGEVQRILDRMGDRQEPTPAERVALHAILGAMLDELKAKQFKIQGLKGELELFSKAIGADQRSIKTAQEAASAETRVDKAKMEAIANEIDSLKSDIKAANTKQAVSAIALGVSLFVLVAAIGVAVATGGAAAPLVVGAVAIVGVAAGTTGLVIYTKEINQKIADLQKKYTDLSDEQRQVTALAMVQSSLNQLLKDCEKAQSALADVQKMWTVLEGKLQSVIDSVGKADTATIRSLIAIHLGTSRSAWGQLVDYAILLQRSGANPEVKVIAHESAKQAA